MDDRPVESPRDLPEVKANKLVGAFKKNSHIFARGNKVGGTKRSSARRRAMFERKFAKLLSAGEFDRIVRMLISVAQDPDHPRWDYAVKEVLLRVMGRVPTKLDVETTHHETQENRFLVVLQSLGIPIDGEVPKFGSAEGGRLPLLGSSEQSSTPVSVDVCGGQEPIPDSREGPPSGLDVGECAEVSSQENPAIPSESEADEPPVFV